MSPLGRGRGDTSAIREHPCLHREKLCSSTAYVYVIKCKIKMKSHSCCLLNESGFIKMIRTESPFVTSRLNCQQYKCAHLQSFVLIVTEESRIYEPRHEISNNVVVAISKASDQPAPRLDYSMTVKLLAEQL